MRCEETNVWRERSVAIRCSIHVKSPASFSIADVLCTYIICGLSLHQSTPSWSAWWCVRPSPWAS